MPLRYSDFNIGSKLRQNEEAKAERKDWIGTEKERLNILMANECDAIVTGLYEYWRCYEPHFPKKTVFIPFPIVVGERPNIPDTPPDLLTSSSELVRVGRLIKVRISCCERPRR